MIKIIDIVNHCKNIFWYKNIEEGSGAKEKELYGILQFTRGFV